MLECDGPISDVGGAGEAIAMDGGGGGDTPEGALAAYLATTPFVIPRGEYALVDQAGDRFAFGYRASGELKVIVVVSPRFGPVIGEAFAVDELRTCPEPEFGGEATFADGRRVWTHVETGAIVTDIAGPGHCGWESARMLHILESDGSLKTQYLRDPEGVFDGAGTLEVYAEGIDLPAEAIDSGFRSPEGYELWLTADETAAYVVTAAGVERWPRAEPPIGCR